MKTPTLLCITALALSFPAISQAQDAPATPPAPAKDGPHPGAKGWCPAKGFGKFRGWQHPAPGKGGFEWGGNLQLTPEQKEKVKAVWAAQKPKIQAIHEEQRAKLKAVFEEIDKEIRPILTAEQLAVLDNAKKLRESEAALRKSQDAAPAPAKK